MGNIVSTRGIGIPHGSFEDEFLTHKSCSEWWYVTGYLEDEDSNRFSFQYTLAQIRIFGIKFHMLLTALTDIHANRHSYAQYQDFFGKQITTNSTETTFQNRAGIRYSSNAKCSFGVMDLLINESDYTLQLNLQAQKSPVWNCEDGKLQMGILDDPNQVTYYYSITNLLVKGVLTLDRKQHAVHGKAWFDRQGGPCKLTNPLTNWEWFSFRFFDDEEIMLFSFPRTGYTDGTYIPGDGCTRRLNEYRIEPLGFLTEPKTSFRFSDGWRVTMPGIKQEEYLVQPVSNGQLNLFFYELLADVINPQGERVGFCVVELLPGARNKHIKPWLALK